MSMHRNCVVFILCLRTLPFDKFVQRAAAKGEHEEFFISEVTGRPGLCFNLLCTDLLVSRN